MAPGGKLYVIRTNFLRDEIHRSLIDVVRSALYRCICDKLDAVDTLNLHLQTMFANTPN